MNLNYNKYISQKKALYKRLNLTLPEKFIIFLKKKIILFNYIILIIHHY